MEILGGPLAYAALRLGANLVKKGWKKLTGDSGEDDCSETDGALVEWSGDLVLKASGRSKRRSGGINTSQLTMAIDTLRKENHQANMEVHGVLSQLRHETQVVNQVGNKLASAINEVRQCVFSSVEENRSFHEELVGDLDNLTASLQKMQDAHLQVAENNLNSYVASEGDVQYLMKAEESANLALVQGHILEVQMRAGVIAVVAGYIRHSKDDSPAKGKKFVIQGPLKNIIQGLSHLWANSTNAATPEGQKSIAYLLDLISSVHLYPPESVEVLSMLDKRLLTAIGRFCALEIEAVEQYPEVGGEAVKSVLADTSWMELCTMADELGLDIKECVNKMDIIQALVDSGRPLVANVGVKCAPTPLPSPGVVDRQVLMTLYEATGGPSWTNNSKWGSAAPVGEWYGVKVDSTGRVSELVLEGNNLQGSIPPELGNLELLKKLELSQNQLSGCIPKELGKLVALEKCYLRINKLVGSIPPELGNLQLLKKLDLSRNQLSGCIPKELGKLVALEKCNLWSNKLVGCIPKELGKLVALEKCNLWSNKLVGSIPPELGNLQLLKLLDLSWNQLSGEYSFQCMKEW